MTLLGNFPSYIHVNVTLTHTVHLKIAAHQHIAPMTAALSQQDSIPQEATESNQKQHEEHNKEHKALTWAPGAPNLMELLQDAPKKARSPENQQQPEEQLPASRTPQETTRGFIAVA